jgi:hypothetical protein
VIAVLAGCASNEGGRVIEQSRAGVAEMSRLAAAGDEASVTAIPEIAEDVHAALGVVLLTDYGREGIVEVEYSTDALRTAVADLRDAHRNRQWLMDSLKSLPYVGPGINWLTGAGGALAALIALFFGKKIRKPEEG